MPALGVLSTAFIAAEEDVATYGLCTIRAARAHDSFDGHR